MSESSTIPFGSALCVLCSQTVPIKDGQLLCCGHAFHKDCFNKWVSKRKTCPTCREPLYSITNLYPSAASSKFSQYKETDECPSTKLISDGMYSVQKRQLYLRHLTANLHVDHVELRDLFTMVKQCMILSRKLYFEGKFEQSFQAIVRCQYLFFRMEDRPMFNIFEKGNSSEVKTCEQALQVMDSAFRDTIDNMMKFHDRDIVDGSLSQQLFAHCPRVYPSNQW